GRTDFAAAPLGGRSHHSCIIKGVFMAVVDPLTICDGWLSEVSICPSPNINERPAQAEISLLVVHNISLPPGEFGGGYVQAFFQNALDVDAHPYFATIAGLQVSAHVFIARDGGITQFAPFDARAWHAGASSFDG